MQRSGSYPFQKTLQWLPEPYHGGRNAQRKCAYSAKDRGKFERGLALFYLSLTKLLQGSLYKCREAPVAGGPAASLLCLSIRLKLFSFSSPKKNACDKLGTPLRTAAVHRKHGQSDTAQGKPVEAVNVPPAVLSGPTQIYARCSVLQRRGPPLSACTRLRMQNSRAGVIRGSALVAISQRSYTEKKSHPPVRIYARSSTRHGVCSVCLPRKMEVCGFLAPF